MKRRPMRWCFVLVPLLATSGCISLGSKQADTDTIYTLQAPPSGNAASNSRARRAVVVVPKPELPSGFATERIALSLDQGRRVDYYAGAKWSARLDDLLQNYVIEKAQQNFPGKIVGTPDLASSARYRLALKFTDFGPVYADAADKPPRLGVGVTVTVIALPGETIRTQFSVKKSAPASANRMSTIASELEALLQAATTEALQKAAPYLG